MERGQRRAAQIGVMARITFIMLWYSDDGLAWWAKRIRCWARGADPPDARLVSDSPRRRPKIKDLFVYFDDDAKVKAPFDAQRLHARLEDGATA
jgi:uncharacterized protein YecE (DUF72 family)